MAVKGRGSCGGEWDLVDSDDLGWGVEVGAGRGCVGAVYDRALCCRTVGDTELVR